MAGLRVTEGRFKDIIAGKRTTIFVYTHPDVSLGDILYLHESFKVNFNKCGYWFSGRVAMVRVTKVTLSSQFYSHVKFEVVSIYKNSMPQDDKRSFVRKIRKFM